MNSDYTPKTWPVWPTVGSKSTADKMGVIRHFWAIWSSQPMGCFKKIIVRDLHALRLLTCCGWSWFFVCLQAMLCYWLTSNVFSLVQVLVLRIPAVRQFCKIAPLVDHKSSTHIQELNVPKQSFMEGFRESTLLFTYFSAFQTVQYTVVAITCMCWTVAWRSIYLLDWTTALPSDLVW